MGIRGKIQYFACIRANDGCGARVADRGVGEAPQAFAVPFGPLSAQSGYEGKIVLIAEEALLPGDARVEWADGGAERDSARLWRQIDEIVARASLFGATPAQATPAQATPAQATTVQAASADPDPRPETASVPPPPPEDTTATIETL